jgi:hypothetical protein
MNISCKTNPLAQLCVFILLAAPIAVAPACAQDAPPAAAPDVLVLSNGDTLHGILVKEVGGKVTFHTESLGDVDIPWEKIKELHAGEKFSVLEKTVKLRGKKAAAQIPTGAIDVEDAAITVHGENAPAAPIAVKDAPFVVDEDTLEKQIHHEPSFFAGWNGAATAGATLVQATQNQYTVSGGIGLVRTVPTVSWLDPRNRTSTDFTGSFGKITQPATTIGGVFTPASTTKSAIYHIDGERDEYFSDRFFGLAQAAFDHNFAQALQLQQVYGGGIGWTIFKTPKQEGDVKGTIQYEKQAFINAMPGENQNLIGSTFAVNYAGDAKLFTVTQELGYIPAYNTPSAYSANETDTLAFPTYKNFAFSVGTIDTYLNDAPIGTKRNSFQFTMGLTYAIKSKY